MQHKLSAQAARELEDILWQGVLTFGEKQAEKYQNSLKRTFELLAYMPGLGRVSERGYGHERRFVHGSHVIYYIIQDDILLIHNILYGPAIQNIWGDE